MTNRPIFLVLVAAGLLVAGCGGGSGPEASSSPSKAKATATAAARSASRDVTVSLDGRDVSGHCAGAQADAVPAIVLESGMGGGQDELANIEQRFTERTLVCSYDRAGIGKSGPPTRSPRPVSALVADLDAFLAATGVHPPYLLVGQSMGGNVVLMYAQAHPDKVAGFVSMNPVPPAETWMTAAKNVMTKNELADERTFYRGGNDEHTTFLEPTLNRPLPARIPYAVMFDEDCGGDTGFCGRILRPLMRTTRSLATVGDGGRFVPAKGAGHAIYQSNPDLVHETINDVLTNTN